jgi:hypothetical protein
MLYFRHQDTSKTRPPELADWVSLSEDAMLHDCVSNGYRICAITPPFMFDPPADGWVPLVDGWQVCSVGPFDLTHHARSACKYPVKVKEVSGKQWMLPAIVTANGERSFPVTYGGAGFLPMLTADQMEDLQLAAEIRTCEANDTWPDMSVRAQWAARLLCRPYSLSLITIGMLGLLNDDIIKETLLVAGGCDGP